MARVRVLAAVLCAIAVAVPSAATAAPSHTAAATATPPGDWVRHVNPPWTWYAPSGWIAAYGPYDLNISSGTGTRWVKYGFSAAPVDAAKTDAANASSWFTYWRNNELAASLTNSGVLYSRQLASDAFTNIGAVRQLTTTQGYRSRWRQWVTFKGIRTNGKRIRGELVMDYAVGTYGDFAAESFQVRAAPRRVYDDVISTLRLVQQLIFYCGDVC